jgi:hypothetical protein
MQTNLLIKHEYLTLKVYLPEEAGPINLTTSFSGQKASGSKVRIETLKRVFAAFVKIHDAWIKTKAGTIGQFMDTLAQAARDTRTTDEFLAVLDRRVK